MERHYGMDWLRIGAFQLLILYHVGMAFVPWPFVVKLADPPLDWTTIPMLLLNPWRLSLLFAVSGFASAAMLARDGRAAMFLRTRLARLGLPLLFGMAVVVPVQPWIELTTQHGYGHGFGYFLAHDYFRPQAIGGVIVPTWMHLWFVVYLLAYTLLLGAMPARWREALAAGMARLLAGPALLPVGIVWVLAARTLLAPGWSDTHTLIDDWSAHAAYLPAFLFGYALARSPALLVTVGRQWRVALTLALCGFAFIAGCEIAWPGNQLLPPALGPWHHLARASESWGAIVGLIGLAHRHANRDGRWRAMLADAVFPFYLIHQTAIAVIGWALLGTATGPLARFAILVAGTAAACWAFYLGGRRIGWLRPLIGLKRVARAPASASAASHELAADDPRWSGTHRAVADLA